ncbi:hypothetical protein D3C73_1495250 [compost metagenome]
MLFDLHKVSGVPEPGCLEQVPGITPQCRHLAELVAIALEVSVIDGVEACQGGEEPDVGLSDGVAHKIPLAAEPFFQPVQSSPQARVGGIVGFL